MIRSRDWRLWLIMALGIVARLVVIVGFVPLTQATWFAPFLGDVVGSPSLDPWATAIAHGVPEESFPYGPGMLLVYAPFAALGEWLPIASGAQWGIAICTLLTEVALWVVVSRWPIGSPRVAVALVALNPLVVYAAYVHGQLDLLPALAMFLCLRSIRRLSWGNAGLWAGIAIAIKLSSLLLPPILLVFLLRNARYRYGVRPFLLGLIPGTLLAVLPAVLPGYRSMVLGTPVSSSFVKYALDLGPGLTVVVLPIVFAAILGLQYSFRRGNPDLTIMCAAFGLCAVPLLSPSSPGWFLWSVAPLAVLAASSTLRIRLVLVVFWISATVTLALRASAAIPRSELAGFQPDDAFIEVGSFVHGSATLGAVAGTATVAAGVVAMLMIYRHLMAVFDSYRLSRKPLTVAIAGDSGTGKDTLSLALADVFGERATSFVLGDDYHLYERAAPRWGVTTHLHPAANDLSSLSDAFARLVRGWRVWSRHYDHARGRFTSPRPTEARELVVLNGLHVLALPEVADLADLRVFMDMDEGLRRALKLKRDVVERGADQAKVMAAIERRVDHAERFVLPQSEDADVVFRLEPIAGSAGSQELADRPLRLVVTLRSTTFAGRLHAALTALTLCPVSIVHLDSASAVRLSIDPMELSARDVRDVARALLDRQEELFVHEPFWRSRSEGAIQLIATLALLDRRRRILP